MQCRIFQDTEKNKLIDSDTNKIITLGRYYPKHDKSYKDMDLFSNMILDVKKGGEDLDTESGEYYYYEEALKHFTNILLSILSAEEEYAICVIPGHLRGTAPSGIRTIAERLCLPPRIDGTKVLSRAYMMQKKASGGVRDSKEEIDSLIVRDESIIKGRQVLLLDDVTTTGTSLNAGKFRLKEAGAEIVAMLALGETQQQ